MCPHKLLCRAKALIPEGHCSVDDVLSIPTDHNKPARYKNALISNRDVILKIKSKPVIGLNQGCADLPLGLC